MRQIPERPKLSDGPDRKQPTMKEAEMSTTKKNNGKEQARSLVRMVDRRG